MNTKTKLFKGLATIFMSLLVLGTSLIPTNHADAVLLASVAITASPSTICSGQSTRLTWSSTDATSISINQGIGSVLPYGSRDVSPTQTTTYTITGTNSTGGFGTASATVYVSGSCTTLASVAITASPSTICPGQSSHITWSSTDATSLSINQGIGSVSPFGSRDVSPTQTTVYTITGSNSTGGSGTASATVSISNSCTTPRITLNVTPGTLACLGQQSNSTTLSWSDVPGAVSYTVKRSSFSGGSYAVIMSGLTSPTFTTPALPDPRFYVVSAVNAQGNEFVTSNEVSTNISTPTCNTPTPTPPPGFTLPSCFPSFQTVQSGNTASFSATGGTGVFFWSAPNGDPSNGFYNSFNTRFFTNNNSNDIRMVVVQSGGFSASCTVQVLGGSVYTPPSSSNNYQLSIQKFGRNITRGETAEQPQVTVSSNDTVEFLIHVRSLSNVVLTNVVVSDSLPAGLTYIRGTTALNGMVFSDGITTSGINIGSLYPNQEAVIRLDAQVNPGAVFPSGTNSVANIAQVQADGAARVTAQLPINRFSIVQVAGVSTGPGESVLLALLFSALITAGYMAYTKTGLFGRRYTLAAARRFMKDQTRLNFARFL